MTQSYTINREKGQSLLQRVAHIPGVRHVAILDAAGLCLAHTGHEPVSTMLLTDWTVIARAAFSACDDLGHRCGEGLCHEFLQTHSEGGTLMHSLTQRMQKAGAGFLANDPFCAIELVGRAKGGGSEKQAPGRDCRGRCLVALARSLLFCPPTE